MILELNSSSSPRSRPRGLMASTSSLVCLSVAPASSAAANLVKPSGEVVEGMDVVKKIEKLGSPNGTASATVEISESGTV